jgi:hypothetical protein
VHLPVRSSCLNFPSESFFIAKAKPVSKRAADKNHIATKGSIFRRPRLSRRPRAVFEICNRVPAPRGGDEGFPDCWPVIPAKLWIYEIQSWVVSACEALYRKKSGKPHGQLGRYDAKQ